MRSLSNSLKIYILDFEDLTMAVSGQEPTLKYKETINSRPCFEGTDRKGKLMTVKWSTWKEKDAWIITWDSKPVCISRSDVENPKDAKGWKGENEKLKKDISNTAEEDMEELQLTFDCK